MSTIEQALVALLGVTLLGGLAGGAALLRLVRPAPAPPKRTPPGPSPREAAQAEEERAKVRAVLEERLAKGEHVDEIAKLPPDEATRARAAERARRRGGP